MKRNELSCVFSNSRKNEIVLTVTSEEAMRIRQRGIIHPVESAVSAFLGRDFVQVTDGCMSNGIRLWGHGPTVYVPRALQTMMIYPERFQAGAYTLCLVREEEELEANEVTELMLEGLNRRMDAIDTAKGTQVMKPCYLKPGDVVDVTITPETAKLCDLGYIVMPVELALWRTYAAEPHRTYRVDSRHFDLSIETGARRIRFFIPRAVRCLMLDPRTFKAGNYPLVVVEVTQS